MTASPPSDSTLKSRRTSSFDEPVIHSRCGLTRKTDRPPEEAARRKSVGIRQFRISPSVSHTESKLLLQPATCTIFRSNRSQIDMAGEPASTPIVPGS